MAVSRALVAVADQAVSRVKALEVVTLGMVTVMVLVAVCTVVVLTVDLVTVVNLLVLMVPLELFGVTVERSHQPTPVRRHLGASSTDLSDVPVEISVTGGLHTPLFYAIILRYSKEHNASIHTHLYR